MKKHWIKAWVGLITCAVITFATACTGMDDAGISGQLTINPKSGFASIDLVDADTGATIRMFPGRYRLTFKQGLVWVSDPSIEIQDASGKILGSVEIPSEGFNTDNGTFEFYSSHPKSRYSFNILGGKRKVRLDVRRQVKLDQYCTYTETYSCQESRQVCTGSGTDQRCSTEYYTTTCTRTVSGEHDELWETEKYQHIYRILFESYDLMNVAEFKADGKPLVRSGVRSTTSCN